MRCPCGKEYETSSATPWVSAKMVGNRLTHATCQHGVSFNFEDFKLGDRVQVGELSFWRGSRGIVRTINSMGKEYGIEIETDPYGKIMIYIERENLKRSWL
jgi:hypothetical protein